MKTSRIAALLIASAALLAARAPALADDPKLAFERYTLDNGLEVILVPDSSVPLVAVSVWYHVGSGDETVGKSGFAHLFEHMLFQGSKHVGEDRHFDLLKAIGGTGINGSTNTDRTNYYEVVPSHHLETALWMESDRMGYLLPLVTDKSLANQREVVRNERRQNYDNVPYGVARFAISAGLYPEGHPYRYLTIGRHEDLERATLDDVTGFYKKWYSPSNATLTLAGDFNVADARKLVDKWFGTFPRSTKPERQKPATPTIERSRVEVRDNFAKLRRIDYAWHSPANFAPGDAELDLIADALAGTGTGRLYKVLVHEKQLAQSVSASQVSRGASYFQLSITAKSDADLAEIEKIVGQELDKLRAESISQRELDRGVAQQEAAFVWSLDSLLERAEMLQRYNHYTGNPDYITTDLDRYRAATIDKVREVANKYLVDAQRVEVITLPAEAAKGAK